MCFSRCIFFATWSSKCKKNREKKRKKCKINAKVQTEMQRWDRQSSRCKKNAIGTGDCKKKTKQPPNCKKNAMWQTKCKKKAMWPAKCKKKAMERAKCKKNAMWQTQCKKKAMWPAKCKKKAMGRAKCKKKSDGTGKVQKKCNWAVCCVSHLGKAANRMKPQNHDEQHLFFFVCVSLCVDLHTPPLLKQLSGQHDVSNTQFFTCQHKTPQMHDWHLFV